MNSNRTIDITYTIPDVPVHSSYTMNCYIFPNGRKINCKEKIMSNKNLRTAIRIIHLLAAATLGMYFYSPIAGNESLRLIIQFVTLPSIVLTGLALWQQASLNKLLNQNKRKSVENSAHAQPGD